MRFVRSIAFFSCVLLGMSMRAQIVKTNGTTPQKDDKEKTDESPFAIAAGANFSSINLSRNYRENPYKLGLDARAYYEANNTIRVMAEYMYTPNFDLDPTWTNVNNQVFNVSANVMTRIRGQEVMVYTITGLSIQRWKGFYTGLQDYSTARFYYQPNSIVLNRTLAADIGLGFERPFPGFYLYGDFRYRFAQIDHAFGITDAAWNLGLKFPIFKDDHASKNKRRKGRSHKASDKYHWF